MFYINLFNNFYFYGEKKNIHLICIYFWEISVVNAVLLKVRHTNCISPGFNQSMIQFEQDTIHTATILWLNNTTTWARSRLAISVNTDTSNINWSIYQTGLDLHGYNTVNYQLDQYLYSRNDLYAKTYKFPKINYILRYI